MLHSLLQPNFPFCDPRSLLSAIKTIEVLIAAASDERKKEWKGKKCFKVDQISTFASAHGVIKADLFLHVQILPE